MLKLYEKIFLITLTDSDSSASHLNYDARFSHTLSGALLLDLILNQTISLEKNTNIVLQNTDNELDTILKNLIELATKPNWTLYNIKAKKNAVAETVKDWLSLGAKIPHLRHQIATQLAEKGILQLATGKLLGMKLHTRYILKDSLSKSLIINQLKEVLDEQKQPTLEEVMLLHLLKIGHLEDCLLDAKQQKDKKFKQAFRINFATRLTEVSDARVIGDEIKKLLTEENHEKIMDAIDTLSNLIDVIGDAFGDAGDGGDGGGDGGD